MWHLGPVTAACLAKKGFFVTGLDPDKSVIENLKKSEAPLFEPGLNELIASGIAKKNLRFSTDPRSSLQDIDYLWVAFDTPVNENDEADVPYVKDQLVSILEHLPTGTGVIISSQVPVGFTKAVEDDARKRFPQKSLVFAASPENLRLGKAISVFGDPDRIVVGIREEKDREKFLPLFSVLSNRLEWMKTESAEMTKHAINAFLATSVAFVNELALICEDVDADALEVAKGLKSESRIGPKAYLNPGAAFAGGTLARDILFLIHLGERLNKPSHLLRAVKESNHDHQQWIKRQCSKYLGSISKKKFALLGLTYKPDTDTLRRSSAVELGKWLYQNGGEVLGYDPKVKELPAELKGKLTLVPNPDSAIEEADCILVATEWPEFKDFSERIIALMSKKIVIDPNGFLRSRFDPLRNSTYISVGRSAHEIKG